VKLYNSGVRLKSILLIMQIDLSYIEQQCCARYPIWYISKQQPLHNIASFFVEQVHNTRLL